MCGCPAPPASAGKRRSPRSSPQPHGSCHSRARIIVSDVDSDLHTRGADDTRPECDSGHGLGGGQDGHCHYHIIVTAKPKSPEIVSESTSPSLAADNHSWPRHMRMPSTACRGWGALLCTQLSTAPSRKQTPAMLDHWRRRRRRRRLRRRGRRRQLGATGGAAACGARGRAARRAASGPPPAPPPRPAASWCVCNVLWKVLCKAQSERN